MLSVSEKWLGLWYSKAVESAVLSVSGKWLGLWYSKAVGSAVLSQPVVQ